MATQEEREEGKYDKAEKRSEIALMPLVQLPSGASVRPDLIVFIARNPGTLNAYNVFFANLGQAPIITGEDMDALREMGVVQAFVSTEPAPGSIVEIK